MIGVDTHVLLRHYLEQGLPKAAIARQLGISVRSIFRWIAEGELDKASDTPPQYAVRPKKARKLDPYMELVRTRLEAYPALTARRLLEEIRAAGYEGGYSQLADLVKELRPRQAVAGPPVRFETPAGHQGQVDFAVFDFPFGRRYALVVVLGYSRLLWVKFFERQDMRTLFTGLEEAFAYFGGVPKELLFDQMKAVITKDLRLQGKQLVVNEEFLRFAAHWSFRPRACRPYRAQTKGKVERPIRYIRENLVYGREFIGDGDLAEQTSRWLERANGRLHATTKEVPRERFERDERLLLMPPALKPYRSLLVKKIAAQGVKPSTHKPAPLPAVEQRPSVPLLAVPRVSVEKRSLTVYAAMTAQAAADMQPMEDQR